MSRDEVLSIINKNDILELIYFYCIDRGKEELRTNQFVTVLSMVYSDIKVQYYNYALQYYMDKYNIILLHDKNGKFIKAF